MGGIGSRIALGLAVAIAAWGAAAAAANAAAMVLPSPTCCTFEAGPWVQDQGEVSILDNSATEAPHDLTSNQTGPDGRPLFQAEAALGGQSKQVNGSQYLAAGTYPFYCQIHGPSMNGELVVTAAGNPVRRPSVKVLLVKQSRKQVRKAGIRVKVKARTSSKGVTVTARKGRALLGVKRGLGFKAGQARTFRIPLSKSGRKAVSKGKVVKISIQATVAFGKPSKANLKLR